MWDLFRIDFLPMTVGSGSKTNPQVGSPGARGVRARLARALIPKNYGFCDLLERASLDTYSGTMDV